MKIVEIITLRNGYYVKYAYGATHRMIFCETEKEAKALAKELKA